MQQENIKFIIYLWCGGARAANQTPTAPCKGRWPYGQLQPTILTIQNTAKNDGIHRENTRTLRKHLRVKP